MLRIIGCIIRDHDPGLVGLACAICLLAAHTATRLLGGLAEPGQALRKTRGAAAVVALATGIWTTDFIGLLAFRPESPSGFSLPLCLLSAVLAFIPAGAVLARVCVGRSVPATAGFALLLSGGVTLMHIVGMRCLLPPVVPGYDAAVAATSFVLGSGFAVAAMACLPHKAPAVAAVLLALAVATIHFVSMGAVEPGMAGMEVPGPVAAPRIALALVAGSGGIMIIGLALAGAMLDQHFSARFAAETRRLRTLADASFEGLMFERAGYVTDVNRAMLALAGVDADALVGRAIDTVIRGFSPGRSTPGRPVDCELLMADGNTRPVEVIWRNNPGGSGRAVAVRDNSREKLAQAQLQRLALFDRLTGLVNRDHFEQLLQAAVGPPERSAVSLALHYIDVDRFEAVYEIYGARASDDSLVQIARRLARLAGPADVVARLGRDEFAIIQSPNDRHADAASLAARIVADLAEPIELDGHTITLTASVGIARCPEDGDTAEMLVKRAALAMRESKQGGRSTWRYFQAEIDLRQHDKRRLERELRQALAEGQFAVHYQAFFDAETLKAAGCEALLRWNHPERGRVPPADFIPIAEENGLIVPIGQWVLATACAEAMSWPADVTVAVNLSPAQFAQEGVVASVAEVLRRTGLPPGRLELEITESTLMGDTPYALRILKALKALGVTIAMDDFGTGYSSLSYLRKFPFDKIKIDRSFLSDADSDPEAETIVETIIAMGQGLRLTITAEGVETPRQLAMLRAHGCSYVQGFLLARPCPAAQLDLSARKPRWLHPAGTPGRLAIAPAQTG